MQALGKLLAPGQLQVFNSWPKGVTLTTKLVEFHANLPPSLLVPTATPTPAPPVFMVPTPPSLSTREYWALNWDRVPQLRSSIDLSFKDSSIKFDFDKVGLKVGELRGPLAQAVGIVAPTVPEDTDGSAYTLSVFSGPSNLRNTLDSIIQANRDSIMGIVQEQLQSLNGPIKNIEAEHLRCSFAAVSKHGERSAWNLDLMLQFSGTVKVKPYWFIWSNAKIPDLMAQLSFTIDTTNSSEDVKQVPQITVHRIQLSCERIDSLFESGISDKLRIASRNSTENKALLEYINGKLSNALSKLGDLAKLEAMEHHNLYTIPQTAPSQSSFEEWMSSQEIQSKQLGQLKIPGTHNSAAYKFDRIISPMLEKGLDKLRNLRIGTAPSSHRLDDTENIYVGQQAYEDLIDHITLLSQAHDESKTLKRQLEDGIRFLDLRIYREEDGEYYNQHFLRGPTLDELLDQIRQFLEEHNSSSEFIIVELAQCNYGGEHGTQVADKIKNKLERWLYMPSDAKAHSGKYDFQTLHNITLGSITNRRPKVLFVSRTSWLEYPHSVLNVDDDSLEKPGNGRPLLPRWFTEVPSNGEEVAHILLNTFDPDARIKNLRHRAYERNAEVGKVLSQKDTPWRYMMDWYTDCKGVEKSEDLPVERIIQANK